MSMAGKKRPSSSVQSKLSFEGKKSKSSMECIENEHFLVLLDPQCKPSEKILAFDLDGTIIGTSSGRVHPKDCDDWKLAFPGIREKLLEKIDQGYKIVVISNQMGVNKKVGTASFRKKLESIAAKLQVPMQFYVSLADDNYRKPRTAIWDQLMPLHNGDLTIDNSQSVFVGDAAGRKAKNQRKADFSSCDRFLAENLRIKFMTPEEFFTGSSAPSPQELNEPCVKPHNLPKINDDHLARIPSPSSQTQTREIILMMGYPASGKSSLVNILESRGYSSVSRDVLVSWQKCVSKMNEHLDAGSSVVVDNTNLDGESRANFIKAVKARPDKSSISVKLLHVQTDLEQCKHNEKYRQLTKADHKPIGDMIFNMMKSKYKEPSKQEGIDEIIPIPFAINEDILDPLFFKHLLAK